MLEWIRQTKSSWGKILIGVISLSFVIFFGTDSWRSGLNGGTNHAAVAKINGEIIPRGTFETVFDQQTKRFGNIKQLPEQLLVTFKQQILQGLIRDSLLSQEAKKIGLISSESELFEQIIGNPSFKVKGQFDNQLYRENFLPYYRETYGREYEDALREGIESDMLNDLIAEHSVLSQLELKDYLALEKQLFRIDRIVLASKDQAKTESQATAFDGKKIGEEIIKVYEKPEERDALLKKYDLKILEGKLESSQKYLLQYRDHSVEIIECALKAFPKPCDHPIQFNDKWTLFILSQKSSNEKLAELDAQTQEQLITGKKNVIRSTILQTLQDKAKVTIYNLQ